MPEFADVVRRRRMTRAFDGRPVPPQLLDEIVELTLVIGKYLSMGRFMQVLGLDQTCSLQFDDDSGRVVAH